MYKPRKYQNNAISAVMKLYRQNQRKILLHLPTGSGKTIIATLIIGRILEENPEHKILFIAHRKEIIDQTKEKISAHLPDESVEIEQGKRQATGPSRIVIASVQSLVRRKESYNADEFDVIICDECHHSLAPSWLETIKYFDKNNKLTLIGMTATARRSDGRSAVSLFGQAAFQIDQIELQELGYLSPIEYHTVTSDLKLDKLAMSQGDFQVKALSKVMNSPPVRSLTIKAWKAKGSGKKTIIFCSGVTHAHQIAADFQSLGYKAAAIDGKTSNRQEILQDFKDGRITILSNYGVLTEGFDEPSIECVMLARPTTSPLVYNQCLGRGLRPYPGKNACTVIDIVDRSTYQLQYSASELTGLPKGWKSNGDPFREKRALSKVRVTKPEAFLAIHNATSLQDVQKILITLPPETVLAGIDGGMVPKYQLTDGEIHKKEAISRAKDILDQAGADYVSVTLDPVGLKLSFASTEIARKEYSFLKWHVLQATGKQVRFSEAPARQVAKFHKKMLKSLLAEEHKIKSFDYLPELKAAHAHVNGLTREEYQLTQQAFEQKFNYRLFLKGEVRLF